MKSYEIYCRNFSQVIQADDIHIAASLFYSANPNEEIVIIENIEARNEQPHSTVGELEFDRELSLMVSMIDQIGRTNDAATRGMAKIRIGESMKRILTTKTN